MTDVTQNDTAAAARKGVALHQFIDAQGNEVDDIQTATGIRYTLLANRESFEYQYKPDEGGRMLALFGAKTKATNFASQARNNPKGAADADEQIAVIREGFAEIEAGTWPERAREPGTGGVIDKDALAEAFVRVTEREATDAGKPIADPGSLKAKVRQKLEDDKSWVSKVRSNPAMLLEYTRIVGKPTKSTSDLLADLG